MNKEGGGGGLSWNYWEDMKILLNLIDFFYL